MTGIYSNIPEELRDLPQWVTYKTKIPYTPATGEKAKSGQPETWATFDAAVAALHSGQYDGLGFQFHDNGIVGVDLDKAIDDSGKVRGWAQEIVEKLNSYTEYSVSGKGLHVFVRGDLPVDGRRKKLSDIGEGIELYKAKRYFAMTGHVYHAAPISQRQEDLTAVYEEYFPETKAAPVTAPSTKAQVVGKDYFAIGLERDAKFRALWEGTRSSSDESSNDLSLMNKLAYWCDRDIDRMIQAFRNSPYAAGKDEKHLRKLARPDYLQRTALEAAAKCRATAADHDRDYKTGSPAPKKNSSDYKPGDFTDSGNAALFAHVYKNQAAYLDSLGWIVWNGQYWDADDLGALGLVIRLTDRMLSEAKAVLSSARKSEDKNRIKIAEAYLKHTLSSRNQPRIQRCLDLASSHLKIKLDRLDSDAHILNTPAGMVDLHTGLLRPHDPAALCTKITGCAPGIKGAEEWQAFLQTITCGDDKLIWFLQQIAGMAAVGQVFMENVVIAYGDGNNGKSTFFNVLRSVLGSYAGSIDPDVLTTHKQNKGADYAELKSKRLVIAAELDEGTRISPKALKQLASTDNMTAERKYKAPEDFTPTHSLILFTNHLPRVGSSDSGTWRRIVLCPFNARISAQGEVKNYALSLFENCGEAILSWVIEGAKEFCRRGHRLIIPEVIEEATDDYREDSDWTQDFFDECCELGYGKTARAGELYSAFREWAKNNGEYVRNKKDFVARLKKHGLTSRRYSQGTFWEGIAIIYEKTSLKYT